MTWALANWLFCGFLECFGVVVGYLVELIGTPLFPLFNLKHPRDFKPMLGYSPGSPTRRKIWDTAGYKRVSYAFEGMCVWEKGVMLLPRGIERDSVRPWRVWN